MAASNTIDIKLVISEEVTRQLAPIANEVRSFHSALASGADRASGSMHKFGGAVRLVHREFSTLTRLTLGGLVGGGVVAGIVAASKALGDMARQSQQLHYQAQALGTTPQFLEQMSDGLHALGVDAETAARDVQGVMSALRDAETFGTKSQLYQSLEKGVHGSGKKLWREIQQQMAGPEGAEGAFKFLITRIDRMMPSGQRAMLKNLGLSSLAFRDLKEVLPQLHKRIQLSREETTRLAIANANFRIEMGNIGRILGSAVMPGLEKVTSAFAKFLQTENGKKFAAQLREWSDSVGTAIAAWIKDEGPEGLNANIQSLKKTIAELKANFIEADKTIKGMGLSWTDVLKALAATTFVLWLTGVLSMLRAIAPFYKILTLLVAGYYGAKWFRDWVGAEKREQDALEKGPRLEDIPGLTEEQKENLRRGPKRYFFPGGRRAEPTSGEGAPKTDGERRADIQAENAERMALLAEIKGLTESVGHVNDFFQIGGPEGSNDGSSGFQFDTTSVIGRPGILGRPETYPKLPAAATPLTRIPGTPRPAQTEGTGFASWYGNRPDLGFRDREDAGRQGVREQDQGIALGDPKTLGKWFYITDPHTGIKHLTQQTDTGPNIRTQKLLDIHASQLARMGYNAKTFPSGRGLWNLERAPAGVEKPGFRGGREAAEEADPIMSNLAGRGGMGGTATVDIDVGGLGQGERDPADLFKPQPLEGAVQMQNATHAQNNSLSFQ